jgi:hypothetical protein
MTPMAILNETSLTKPKSIAALIRPTRLGWSEAWRIAGRISFEVQFRSNLQMSAGAMRGSVEKRAKNARSSSTMNKVVMSILIGFFAGMYAFVGRMLTMLHILLPTIMTGTIIAVITAMFLGIGFALFMFIGLLQSTTYVSCDVAALVLQLPVSYGDAERLVFLGYLRLLDAPIVVMLVSFPVALGFATLSLLGSLACLAATAMTIILAISAMLVLSHFFYVHVQPIGGSRIRGVLRTVFVLLWAFSFIAASFSYQLISFAIPLITILSTYAQSLGFVLPLLFPFTLGYLVAYATAPAGVPSITLLPSTVGIMLYTALALLGLRQSARILLRVSQSTVTPQVSPVTQPIVVHPSSPRMAIIHKDLRVSFRTPSQAVMLVTPIFSSILIHLTLLPFASTGFPVDFAFFSILLICPFLFLFFSFPLLGTETYGASLTVTLPLHTRRIMQAKALLATLTYLPIPIIQTLLLIILPTASPMFLWVLGLSQILLLYSTSVIALCLFLRLVGGGRTTGFDIGQHLLQMAGVVLISLLFYALPSILYVYIWFEALARAFPLVTLQILCLQAYWIGIAINLALGLIFSRLLLRP